MTDRSRGKPIRLTAHASGYLDRRGFTANEVVLTVCGSDWLPARNGRLEATRDFPFDTEWNEKRFAIKPVRAVLLEEADEIVFITVYTYFFETADQGLPSALTFGGPSKE